MITIQRPEGFHTAEIYRLLLDWRNRHVEIDMTVTLPDGSVKDHTVRYDEDAADVLLAAMNHGDFRASSMGDAAIAATVYDGSIRKPTGTV